MKVLKATPSTIKKAAEIIKNGGLVAFPTETVYGLGAEVYNPYAVARIFEVKNRPHFDPLIVHIADLSQLKSLCLKINTKASKLIEKFWPGPLTIVLPKSSIVPDIVTAGLKTVAIRMPSHPVALALIQSAQTPIAAPSANPFGYLSPTTAQHVKEQLGDKVNLILDGGKCPIGVESTVIYLNGEKATILRIGGLTVEAIKDVIGKVEITSLKVKGGIHPLSPGQLHKHYSPKTPIRILAKTSRIAKGKKIGILAFQPPARPPKKRVRFAKSGCDSQKAGAIHKNIKDYSAVEILSPKGDLVEAAANLFSCLHRLDKLDLDIIYAEPVKEIGLGRAIMDRLRRASYRRQ